MHRMPGPAMKARMQRILYRKTEQAGMLKAIEGMVRILNTHKYEGIVEFYPLNNEPPRLISIGELWRQQMSKVDPAFRKFHRNRYW